MHGNDDEDDDDDDGNGNDDDDGEDPWTKLAKLELQLLVRSFP